MSSASFGYFVAKELIVTLNTGKPYELNSDVHREFVETMKQRSMVYDKTNWSTINGMNFNAADKELLSQLNARIGASKARTHSFHYYPLLKTDGSLSFYTCAYCLNDVTDVRTHVSQCFAKHRKYRANIDCVHCNTVQETVDLGCHFYDQNHTTVLQTAFILDDVAGKYTKVDARHYPLESLFALGAADRFAATFQYSRTAALSALQIVTRHTRLDRAHTASYLQYMDKICRNAPLQNDSFRTPCFTPSIAYSMEMPINPFLMFETFAEIDTNSKVTYSQTCKNANHSSDSIPCPHGQNVIASIADEDVFNPFILIIKRRLSKQPMPLTSFYNTSRDPDDEILS